VHETGLEPLMLLVALKLVIDPPSLAASAGSHARAGGA
jgi:hypothetical protein